MFFEHIVVFEETHSYVTILIHAIAIATQSLSTRNGINQVASCHFGLESCEFGI